VSVSQPFIPSRSQSAYGAEHIPTTQVPFAHAGTAFATEHCAPHAPQCATFVCASTQPPLQQVCPVGHICRSLQPATQRLPTQSVPAGQCVSFTHSTHARVVGSHRSCRPPTPASPPPAPASPPPVTPQASSSWQPERQRCCVVSQYCPAPQAFRIAVQPTQRRVVRSHTGAPVTPAQSSSPRHMPGTRASSGGRSAGTSTMSIGAGASTMSVGAGASTTSGVPRSLRTGVSATEAS